MSMPIDTIGCPTLALVAVLLAAPLTGRAEAPPGEDLAAVVAGSNAFTWDLYGRLARAPQGNLVVSPASVSTALAMTWAGARGDTAAEMARTLHFDLPPDRLHAAQAALMAATTGADGVRLEIANRLWAQKDFDFRAEFLQIVSADYGGGFETLDFVGDLEGSRLRINAWVAERTHDKIGELLEQGVLSTSSRLVLTNAIYFKGDWLQKFDARITRPMPFWTDGKSSVEARMMILTAKLGYADGDPQVLELPYAGKRLSMVVLVPKQRDGLTGLEATLAPATVDAWIDRLKTTEVQVLLPKFTIRCPVALGETLASMGMQAAFSDAADFSGMTGSDNLKIDKVVHETFIEVNERGTEAAAATGVGVGVTSVPPPPPVVLANHPFVFMIRDRESGLILFTGHLVNPKA